MLTQHIQKTVIRFVEEVPDIITWEKLCDVSPELMNIRDDAKMRLNRPQDRLFWDHYENLKRRMASCVGMYAHPGLPNFVHTSQAYDLAHKEIFGELI